MMRQRARIGILIWLIILCRSACGDIIQVTNAGFEDTSGQTIFNEFTFGVPNGWTIHDPNSILGAGIFTGTLEPNGVDFFDTTAPEGVKVGILFNSTREGDGEYGFAQTLSETLQANTRYRLQVEVGNIGSGFATNGYFFDLSEFPGYRVDLLAGNTVIAQDNDSLVIPERQWGTSVVELTTGASHALLGETLSIRLVNLNQIPAGFNQGNSPDLEVDFDDVVFESFAVPEPFAIGMTSMTLLFGFACLHRRNQFRRKDTRRSKRNRMRNRIKDRCRERSRQ